MNLKLNNIMLPVFGALLLILAKIIAPAGFAPVIAISVGMFAFNPRPGFNILMLLAGLFFSDLILANIQGSSYAVFMSGGVFLFYYALYAVCQLNGGWLTKLSKRLLIGTLGSVLIFWIVSNLLTFFEGQLYPYTWNGFITCYTMALPFLLNSILANGIAALIIQYVAKVSKLSSVSA